MAIRYGNTNGLRNLFKFSYPGEAKIGLNLRKRCLNLDKTDLLESPTGQLLKPVHCRKKC